MDEPGVFDQRDDRAPKSASYPFGSYRRRIRVVNTTADCVVGGLEDDFHYFVVTVSHDGGRVTSADTVAHRWPWTTCPDAGARLAALIGMELSPRCVAVGDVTNPRWQCTHQFDLAGLAIAHATRPDPVRQYDVEVPFGAQGGGPRPVRLWRDGEVVLTWTLDSRGCVAPEPYASAPWRGGFLRWADRTLPVDDAEAAIVLRRACDIGMGRGMDLEGYARASELVVGGTGVCYTFQPEVAAVGLRERGMIRNWDGREHELLGRGPGADLADGSGDTCASP